jgi:hypothetical protein
MGQLTSLREYPTPAFTAVTAPKADPLYTTGFFDVGKEPWVLSIPDMKGRYYLMPLLDGWTTVFQVPGTRTTGTGAHKEANWLPAPAGKFILMMRLYWPDETDPSILDGSWTIPPVTKAV